MIKANAVVDVIKEPCGKNLGKFRVEVWGEPPYDEVRIYEILSMSHDKAAREGLDMFVAEMLKFPDAELRN